MMGNYHNSFIAGKRVTLPGSGFGGRELPREVVDGEVYYEEGVGNVREEERVQPASLQVLDEE